MVFLGADHTASFLVDSDAPRRSYRWLQLLHLPGAIRFFGVFGFCLRTPSWFCETPTLGFLACIGSGRTGTLPAACRGLFFFLVLHILLGLFSLLLLRPRFWRFHHLPSFPSHYFWQRSARTWLRGRWRMNLSGSVHILSRHVRKSHLGLLTSPPSWIFLYIYIYILCHNK